MIFFHFHTSSDRKFYLPEHFLAGWVCASEQGARIQATQSTQRFTHEGHLLVSDGSLQLKGTRQLQEGKGELAGGMV